MKKEISNKEKASAIRALKNAGWSNAGIMRFLGFKTQNDVIKFLKQNQEEEDLLIALTLYFNHKDIKKLDKLKEKMNKLTYLEAIKELIDKNVA